MYVRNGRTLGDFSSLLTDAGNFVQRVGNVGAQIQQFATRAQSAVQGGQSAYQEPNAAAYGGVAAARVTRAAKDHPVMFIGGGVILGALAVSLLRRR